MLDLPGSSPFAVALCLALGASVACGGRLLSTDDGSGGAAGSGASGGSGGSGASGGSCVDIQLGDYDRSCTQDSDCVTIETGKICAGDCPCEVGVVGSVNQSSQTRYDSALSSIEPSICSCPFSIPRCVEGQCSVCTDGPSCFKTPNPPARDGGQDGGGDTHCLVSSGVETSCYDYAPGAKFECQTTSGAVKDLVSECPAGAIGCCSDLPASAGVAYEAYCVYAARSPTYASECASLGGTWTRE